MAKTASEHLDKRTVERKGWFQKVANDPRPDYHKECEVGGRGYLGPRHEAHHILPQDSIEKSIQESGKDERYIRDVQYITDWNINHPENLIGLPHYHSYDLYYQGQTRLSAQVGEEQERKLIAWFNKFELESRRRWLEELTGQPPKLPIHNPINWGHLEYTAEVKQEIKKNVWDKINDKKKKHELDAKTIAKQLNSLAEMNYEYLVNRGKGVSEEKWNRRSDPNDNGWYKPFTMADVYNPIFG